VIQLYEMIVVRHGLMLVGPTGGGKSANLHVLEDTLTELKRRQVHPLSCYLSRLVPLPPRKT
jgi:type II secretory ATPase GspE/PulE/Tfp pilus assembly ATPase PilB-like protein